jgi:hypothetical protein
MSFNTSYNFGQPFKNPSNSGLSFANANPLPAFKVKKAEKPSNSGLSFANANPLSTLPPLPDFKVKKAEKPSSSGLSFGNANQPSVFANRSTLREDLNTVIKMLKRWSYYPYFVLQAVDAEKIDVKELFGCTNAIIEVKDKIVLTFI